MDVCSGRLSGGSSGPPLDVSSPVLIRYRFKDGDVLELAPQAPSTQ